MANPLMNMLGNMAMSNMSKGQANGNNPMAMIQQFMKFKNEFQGDPQQALNQMVSSGKYTQEQINQAKQVANQIAPMLKQFGIK